MIQSMPPEEEWNTCGLSGCACSFRVTPRTASAKSTTRNVVKLSAKRACAVVVLASALLFVPAAAMAEARQAQASKDQSLPSGLVVVIADKPQVGRLDLRALRDPFVSGVALQIRWRDIEPAEGKPDWSKLDQLFAAAVSSNKWVQLLIFPGFFSPAWALEGVETEPFPIQYGPGRGTVERLPMPWDTVYLTRWFAFLRQLSDRYGNSPALRVIAADGPTSVSAEFTCQAHPKMSGRGSG